VPAGTWTLTAIVTTTQNISTTSAPIVITVLAQGGNIPPTCQITQPTQNQSFASPSNITIAANATDANGTITKVDFYNGTTLLGTDNTAPYGFVWQNIAAGTYTITAKATDNQGASTTSSPVNITVNNIPVNQVPVVSITQPTQNQSFTNPTNVTIAANATDADGTITKVDFYNGTTLLGTDNTAPYGFVWQNIAAGTYTITAKATDNQGATTTSLGINITILPANTNPPCSQYAQYVEGTAYTNGSIVTNNGGVYNCSVSGWCSGAAWAYSPGIGTAWSAAWTQTGTCAQAALNCSTIAAYATGTTYQTGSIVKNNNTIYQCQIPSWCSGSALAYEPGVGNAWSSAWQSLGACPSNMPKIGVIKNNNTAVAFLFPNPTYEELNITIPNAPIGNIKMTIFDAQGKLIFTQNIDNQNNMLEDKINTSEFIKGFYLIKIETNDWNGTWRVVKQ
jgi:hypothetical protein